MCRIDDLLAGRAIPTGMFCKCGDCERRRLYSADMNLPTVEMDEQPVLVEGDVLSIPPV